MIDILPDEETGKPLGVAFKRNAVLLSIPDSEAFIWGYIKCIKDDGSVDVEGEEMTKEQAVDMCSTFLAIYAPEMLADKQ